MSTIDSSMVHIASSTVQMDDTENDDMPQLKRQVSPSAYSQEADQHQAHQSKRRVVLLEDKTQRSSQTSSFLDRLTPDLTASILSYLPYLDVIRTANRDLTHTRVFGKGYNRLRHLTRRLLSHTAQVSDPAHSESENTCDGHTLHNCNVSCTSTHDQRHVMDVAAHLVGTICGNQFSFLQMHALYCFIPSFCLLFSQYISIPLCRFERHLRAPESTDRPPTTPPTLTTQATTTTTTETVSMLAEGETKRATATVATNNERVESGCGGGGGGGDYLPKVPLHYFPVISKSASTEAAFSIDRAAETTRVCDASVYILEDRLCLELHCFHLRDLADVLRADRSAEGYIKTLMQVNALIANCERTSAFEPRDTSYRFMAYEPWLACLLTSEPSRWCRVFDPSTPGFALSRLLYRISLLPNPGDFVQVANALRTFQHMALIGSRPGGAPPSNVVGSSGGHLPITPTDYLVEDFGFYPRGDTGICLEMEYAWERASQKCKQSGAPFVSMRFAIPLGPKTYGMQIIRHPRNPQHMRLHTPQQLTPTAKFIPEASVVVSVHPVIVRSLLPHLAALVGVPALVKALLTLPSRELARFRFPPVATVSCDCCGRRMGEPPPPNTAATLTVCPGTPIVYPGTPIVYPGTPTVCPGGSVAHSQLPSQASEIKKDGLSSSSSHTVAEDVQVARLWVCATTHVFASRTARSLFASGSPSDAFKDEPFLSEPTPANSNDLRKWLLPRQSSSSPSSSPSLPSSEPIKEVKTTASRHGKDDSNIDSGGGNSDTKRQPVTNQNQNPGVNGAAGNQHTSRHSLLRMENRIHQAGYTARRAYTVLLHRWQTDSHNTALKNGNGTNPTSAAESNPKTAGATGSRDKSSSSASSSPTLKGGWAHTILLASSNAASSFPPPVLCKLVLPGIGNIAREREFLDVVFSTLAPLSPPPLPIMPLVADHDSDDDTDTQDDDDDDNDDNDDQRAHAVKVVVHDHDDGND